MYTARGRGEGFLTDEGGLLIFFPPLTKKHEIELYKLT